MWRLAGNNKVASTISIADRHTPIVCVDLKAEKKSTLKVCTRQAVQTHILYKCMYDDNSRVRKHNMNR
jgi:hypothetical protein